MKSFSATTDEAVFSATIVRSLNVSGSTYRELFQMFDADQIDTTKHPILGEFVVDEFTFSDAPKLGPAVIYLRMLELERDDQIARYFARNKAVVLDSERRREIESTPNFVWPSDEEYVAGFREIYPPGFLEKAFQPPDPVWDAAAMRSAQWLTARAVVRRAGETLEVLCWLVESARVTEAEVYEKVLAHFTAQGFRLIGGFFELFQSHALRPRSGTIVFEVARTSALNQNDYVQRFVQPKRR